MTVLMFPKTSEGKSTVRWEYNNVRQIEESMKDIILYPVNPSDNKIVVAKIMIDGDVRCIL